MKTQKKQPYLPADDNGKMVWLNNFSAKLAIYASLLGITTAQLLQIVNDAADYVKTINFHKALKEYLHNLTEWKNHLRSGNKDGTPVAVPPAAPVVPTFSATLKGDIFGRVSKTVTGIKVNGAYTPEMGLDLGIIGADDSHAGPLTARTILKPVLKRRLKNNHPLLSWKKNHMHAIKILVDRGTGTYALLGIFTKHSYLDIFALPAVGVAAVWKYKAIYYDNDEETGEYSDIADITVTGV